MDALLKSSGVGGGDDDDALTNFVDSLIEEEENNRKITPCYNEETETTTTTTNNMWSDIANALNEWTQKLLDTETCYHKTENFQESIELSLRRQQIDGFINEQDMAELRYIKDLWVNLLNSISTYNNGCVFVKRDIITFLLELHKVRQITDCMFIEICLQL